MKPSIGRIVHFVSGDLHFAAIITAVHEKEYVDLTIFYPSNKLIAPIGAGPYAFDESGKQNHSWHWPERE
jgi:hypothetical protein